MTSALGEKENKANTHETRSQIPIRPPDTLAQLSRPNFSPFLFLHLGNLPHERLKHPKRVRFSVCHVIFVSFSDDCTVEWDEQPRDVRRLDGRV